ncbi:PAS domain S-box protein [Natronorubrum thiooxidans]|uniref:PAS domain S-box-containing protein n=1 Tax=Natronorubrum thiooxidans TaxID=308853 RepID=A0A1N7CQQ6_9EURY|nr:PAS domain S-box protein [Natronorubrum thiooxidans]SIR65939.1 PAS domain S-box-containing protein [Natronorubrum thiooxidans]
MGDREDTATRDSQTDSVDSAGGQQYRALVELLDDGVYRLDSDGHIIAVNDALVEITSYARRDLLGEHVSSIVGERDVTRLEREIRTRLETAVDDDTTFEVGIETADGNRLPCTVQFSLLVTAGEFDGTVGIVRPVDASALARSKSDQRFESLVDAVEEYAIFMLDPNGHVVSWNEGPNGSKATTKRR